jgi:hypothetical protein
MTDFSHLNQDGSSPSGAEASKDHPQFDGATAEKARNDHSGDGAGFSSPRGFVQQGKSQGAERLSGLARVARDAAEQLHEQSPAAAHYVREAADRIDGVSRGIRDSSVDELMMQVADFARRQPVMFFGASVLAGVALSRLLKTAAISGSPPRSDLTS